MWGFLLKGLFYLVLSIIFRPKDDQYDPPEPGVIDIPLSEEGVVISRGWGTWYQTRFHVQWYGDKRQVAKTTSTGKK